MQSATVMAVLAALAVQATALPLPDDSFGNTTVTIRDSSLSLASHDVAINQSSLPLMIRAAEEEECDDPEELGDDEDCDEDEGTEEEECEEDEEDEEDCDEDEELDECDPDVDENCVCEDDEDEDDCEEEEEGPDSEYCYPDDDPTCECEEETTSLDPEGKQKLMEQSTITLTETETKTLLMTQVTITKTKSPAVKKPSPTPQAIAAYAVPGTPIATKMLIAQTRPLRPRNDNVVVVDQVPADINGDTAVAKWILQYHNEWRGQFAANPIKWSPELATHAQSFASQCVATANPLYPFSPNANYLMIHSKNTTEAFKVDQLLGQWAAQWSDYDFANSGPIRGKETDEFTAMIWKGVEEVGCGWTYTCMSAEPSMPRLLYFTCEYRPTPNTPGQYASMVSPFQG